MNELTCLGIDAERTQARPSQNGVRSNPGGPLGGAGLNYLHEPRLDSQNFQIFFKNRGRFSHREGPHPKATKAPKNAISRLLVINEKRDVAFKAQVLKV